MNQGESDGAVASSMYQDGVLHMLTTVLSGTALGNSKEQFEKSQFETRDTLQRYFKKGNFIEVAYFGGQYEVIKRFCNREKTKIPAYFHPKKLIPTHKYIKGR